MLIHRQEFCELKSNLVKKFQSQSSEKCYSDFMEDFVKELCAGLDMGALKRISLTTKPLNEEILLHEEKSKMVKAANKTSKQRDKNVCQKESVVQNGQSLLSTGFAGLRAGK